MTTREAPTEHPPVGGSGTTPVAESAVDRRTPTTVLITVMCGIFCSGFTITIVAVSATDIAKDVHASVTATTWMVTGPMLGLAIGLPVLGKLGDIRGHRRMYLLGLGVFAVANALTAASWNGTSLIAFRTLSGIAGGAIGPASLALALANYDDDQRLRIAGWWAAVGGAAPVSGLVAGGPLVDAFGWRSVFIVVVPIALAALVVGAFVLRETPPRADVGLDTRGAATIGLSCFGVLFALSQARQWPLSHPGIWCSAVVGVLAGVAFFRWEARASHPLLPPRYMHDARFIAPMLASFTMNFAYMGGFFITPMVVRSRFGYSVFGAAMLMAIRPLVSSILSPTGGRLASVRGSRFAVLTGVALVVLGTLTIGAAAFEHSIGLVVAGLIISGTALGLATPALVAGVANAVDHDDLGIANAAYQMLSQIGVVAGITTMAVVQGTDRSAGRFLLTYVVGASIAVLGAFPATRIAAHGVSEPGRD